MSVVVQTRRLGDPEVAEVILGQSPPSTTYNEHREGLPFYQGKADFGLVHPTPRVWCTQGSKFAKPDDVLMSVRAPVGDVNMATEDAVVGRGVSAIRAAEGVDPWYLYFALGFMKPALEAQATGSTFASVNGATLRDLEIPFVAFDHQVAIGRTLRLLLTQLQGEETALKATAETKAAAMQRLFSQGLRGEAQKESEIGPIPGSWDLVPLGGLGRIGNGSTPKRSNSAYWEGGTFPWLNSAKVYDRDIRDPDQFVTNVALQECHLPVLKPGAVLVAITGQGKTLGNVAVLSVQATINQHLAYLQTDLEKAVPKFVRAYLETKYDYLRSVASGGGSTKGALTCGFLRAMTVPMPPTIDEQQAIVDVLDAIDRKIDLHRRKREVLEQLFKSLLHKLMTGEVSVDDLDLSALPKVARSAA